MGTDKIAGIDCGSADDIVICTGTKQPDGKIRMDDWWWFAKTEPAPVIDQREG